MLLKSIRLPYLLIAFCFISCEKTIQFAPHSQSAVLVVDATIENGKRPIVFLTSSVDYFSRISASKLQELFVRHAEVLMSNGEKTDTLVENVESAGNGFNIYYYTNRIDDVVNSFLGEQGRTYKLTIRTNGQEYTAATTIPVIKKTIDALYYETHVDQNDTTKVNLYGFFTDPAGLGNYTRYFTKTNKEDYYPGLNSVFDDQITDGKKYKLQIEKGVNRNEKIDFQNYSFFHRGDTVTVKYCNIDKEVFDFWRTMEYSYSSIGNPFSSPTRVQGNISNGALGYFGGYAAQYSSIIIPK